MASVAVESTAARPSTAIRWSGTALVAASWVSAAAFGIYILTFYLGNGLAGRFEQWNGNLNGLYTRNAVTASLAIGAHFATGAILLILGPLQLIGAVRRRYPALHRWGGRIYVFASAVAGIGGLLFIALRGTIGGTVMSIGFGLYGALMIIAATQTYRHARGRNWDQHRVWAFRLFALAIGSWLYRMDYGVWLTGTHRLGHTSDFRGWFDIVMAFSFYVPNLAIAEILLRSRTADWSLFARAGALVVINSATLVVLIGTYYFLRYYWGPAIIEALGHLAV